MTWPNDSCAECDADLPVCRPPDGQIGYRIRPVPRLGGRRKRVCQPCADRIDQQQTLWGADVERAVRARQQAANSDFSFGALAGQTLDPDRRTAA